MKKSLLAVFALTVVLVFLPTANSQRPDDGCSLPFRGSARRAVKMRSPDLNYPKFNNGNPISVAKFLEHVCALTPRRPIPATRPMDMEKVTMTVKGFVLAMKHDPDNDLHIQIADTASPYRQTQIIVEIPPTQAYCEDARSKMMKLYRDDSRKERLTRGRGYVFNDPPQVEFTGYLFVDSHHGVTCTGSGGRGIKNGLRNSPVKGTWELHPVISLN